MCELMEWVHGLIFHLIAMYTYKYYLHKYMYIVQYNSKQ